MLSDIAAWHGGCRELPVAAVAPCPCVAGRVGGTGLSARIGGLSGTGGIGPASRIRET